ncbi:MAG: GerW family sporulation protein [Lachnospiraceae bacterium]|nr:GerW family sporulation protein [Lachnospiraceae bacterium]
MADNNCGSIIESLLKGMEAVLSSKTVVGDATHIGDTIILPLVDISFGVGAGSSTKGEKGNNHGGGGGMSGKVTPSAVLVIKNGTTKLVNIKNQDAITKVIDLIPDMFDRFADMKNKKDMPSDEEALDAAFPEDEE